MVKVISIPGIMWAADIMTGQRPFTSAMPERRQESEDGDFQSVLDRAMKDLEVKHGEDQ